MARKHYYISFKDKVVVYSLHEHLVPTRVIEEYQLKLMNLMFKNLKELSFSCTDEEFYQTLTPNMYEKYKELKSNEFEIKSHEESVSVLECG